MTKSYLLIPIVILIFIGFIAIPHSLSHQALAQYTTKNNEQTFVNSFLNIIDESNLLTHNYEVQVQKWTRGEYDNKTMISITDSYLPKYHDLINKTNYLHTPAKYQKTVELYTKSLDLESESRLHFKNYLLAGNRTENEKSTQFLSDAFKYEMDSFRAFKSVAESNKDK